MNRINVLNSSLLYMVLMTISQGLSTPAVIADALAEANGQRVSAAELKQKLNYAHQQGYLKRFGEAQSPHYQLSRAGEQRLAQLKFQSVEFDPAKWDGQWRILIFDVPEERRSLRDMIRRLIKQLGMQRLQRSVWLTPVDCHAEFEELRGAYDLGSNLLLLEVRHSPELNQYRRSWQL